MKQVSLVGDVGGTNARLALCDLETGSISHSLTYSGLDYPSLEAVVRVYLDQQSLRIEQACIGIACPIDGDQVSMTNHSWAFSIKQMQENLGLKKLTIINDFTAVSMAIPVLGADDKVQLGGGLARSGKPIAVYGAGTGLGVAHLVQSCDRWLSLPGEGGHVDMASCTEQEDALIQQLRLELGHVSAERLLSGPGLVNIYKGLVTSDHRVPEILTPKQISDRALSGECHDCHRALSLFCVLMGRFAGNLALNLGTFGGVYIAGGLVPRFLEFFKASGFREAFADKGRFKEHLEAIPVYVITHSQPGLLGAGAYLRQSLGITL
ncbi:glucokinase [Psychromonas ingrahamii 37]|uniref:Glucokinase n=1 Tax=Psychromonas ingrahamii (strain DSM 17664 / CCUG 51855 / 37) TaxID=357804 RepID=GLK_PSYIN|nr:glucokinase [Psychromonas ingrahamii]A1SXA4.1 RecName: Full=Glucokinase; AltName: Full=Glucose kinase [Psychromonas ingrahamii 37]ABM04119.1 glucokinase [Psychromonas ingrahamii 37]